MLPCELTFGFHQGAFIFDLPLAFIFHPLVTEFDSCGGPSFLINTFRAYRQGLR